jgi:SOS-response transcriptional repressor LexA
MKSIDDVRRENLKKAVDELFGGSQTAAAARLGKDKPTQINHWLNGAKNMSKDSARLIEAKFELPPFWMDAEHSSYNLDAPMKAPKSGMIVKSPTRQGGNLEKSNTEPGPDIKGKYPLISWVQAGAWESIVDNFAPGDAEEWLDAPVRVSQSSYYLRVRGESMYDPADHRSFHEGEKVLVDPNADAEHGSFVVVRLDDESEATFKQLIIEGDKKYLKALNPNWPNRIFQVNGNATICGVVKGKFVDGY